MAAPTYEEMIASLGMKSPQELMALKLRNQETFKAGNQEAHRLDPLAFVAQGMNNEPLGKAMAAQAANQQSRYKPVKSLTGFIDPNTGEAMEDSGHVEEKQRGVLQHLQQAKIAADAKAATEASQSADRASQRGVAMAIATANNDARASREEDKATKAEEKAAANSLESDVKLMSKRMSAGGVAELESAISKAEKRLASHPEGSLPGFGRLVGGVNSKWLNAEQQASRQDIAGLKNIKLKERSGSAVTPPELVRFVEELGTGFGMDEATLRRGVVNLRDHLEAIKSNHAAGISQEALDLYNQRRGTNIRHHDSSVSVPGFRAASGAAPASNPFAAADAILGIK